MSFFSCGIKKDGFVVFIFFICGIFKFFLKGFDLILFKVLSCFDIFILLLFMDKVNLFYRFVCDWCVILSLILWVKLN